MNNKKKLMRAIMSHNELGALIPLALILIIVAFVNPNFFGAANLIDILRTASFSFFIGVPLTYLLPYALGMGTRGVFMAEPVSNVIGGSLCFLTMLATVIPELNHMEKQK